MSYQRNICLISSILICTAIKFTNAANVYHHEIKYRSTGNEKMCVTESCIETANSLFKVSCDTRYFNARFQLNITDSIFLHIVHIIQHTLV